MSTIDRSEFETAVVQLAKKLSVRQRRICVLMIEENPFVKGHVLDVLLEALGAIKIQNSQDPVDQAILEMSHAAIRNEDGSKHKAAYTMLLSLGILPDLKVSIDFLRQLSELVGSKAYK